MAEYLGLSAQSGGQSPNVGINFIQTGWLAAGLAIQSAVAPDTEADVIRLFGEALMRSFRSFNVIGRSC